MTWKPTDEFCAMLNELLAGSTPAQAYAIGVVSVMAIKDGLEPDRQLLYAASTVSRVSLEDSVYAAWKKSKGAPSS